MSRKQPQAKRTPERPEPAATATAGKNAANGQDRAARVEPADQAAPESKASTVEPSVQH